MNSYKLPESEREMLLSRHKKCQNLYEGDTIKAVLLRDMGWSSEKISQALLIDRSSVDRRLSDYHHSKKVTRKNMGRKSDLNVSQTEELILHLEKTLYQHKHQIVSYVKKTYGVVYSISGMQKWLTRNGFVYKQPKGIPYKACAKAQAEFISKYEALKSSVGEDEPILFMDAAHPTQATKLTHGWIKKGTEKAVPTNGSRTRINLLGAIQLGAIEKAIINRFDCNT